VVKARRRGVSFSVVSDVEIVAHLDTSTLVDDGPIVLRKNNSRET
jgi:hypothetical protein